MSDEPKALAIPKPPEMLAVPSSRDVTDVDRVVGRNIVAMNLRDHAELSGMDFIACTYKFKEGVSDTGMKTVYLLIGGFLLPHDRKEPRQDDLALIMTGAENVIARIVAADQAGQLSVENKKFIRGTFRKSGRAWFFDGSETEKSEKK
jgi:hypothetical protein